jgi:hypothetical protein
MKKIALYIFVFALAFSCKKDDEKVFPIEPYIEFKSFKFGKGNIGNWDSLNVEFYYRDGDADFGLTETTTEPYNFRNYFFKSSGKKYTGNLSPSIVNELINYKFKRLNKPDTLPSFVTPFSCRNWEIYQSQNFTVNDTLYFQANPNYYNLFIDNYVFSNGNWSKFDFSTAFTYPNCSYGVNARAPSLENFQLGSNGYGPFIINKISSKEGSMIYSIKSFDLDYFFSGKKIKLKVRIQDRAFHKSNEIETSEIQF